jgi:protein-S-isoprenylcysteine O-methyltransferase Ste14
MSSSALTLYAIHAALWGSFCVARVLVCRRASKPSSAPRAAREHTAGYSRTFLVFHVVGILVFYLGMAEALLTPSDLRWAIARRALAVLLFALGAAVIAWAIASLHTWRFRAKLDEGHLLTTTGAFSYMRHPIYAGMNLAALATFLWVPTAFVCVGAMLIVAGSELRARAEESVLAEAFGSAYTEYAQHTKRFIPYIY